MKDFEIHINRAQELADECEGDPLDLALMAIKSIDAHAAVALILVAMLKRHPELTEEARKITWQVMKAQTMHNRNVVDAEQKDNQGTTNPNG